MSRIVNVLFALVLLAALVIALDPQSRSKAEAAVRSWEPTFRQWNKSVVVNVPSVSVNTSNERETPVPTATVVANNGKQIPVTGDENATNKPIVQVNWDALGVALKQFWTSLANIKIDFHFKDNK